MVRPSGNHHRRCSRHWIRHCRVHSSVAPPTTTAKATHSTHYHDRHLGRNGAAVVLFDIQQVSLPQRTQSILCLLTAGTHNPSASTENLGCVCEGAAVSWHQRLGLSSGRHECSHHQHCCGCCCKCFGVKNNTAHPLPLLNKHEWDAPHSRWLSMVASISLCKLLALLARPMSRRTTWSQATLTLSLPSTSRVSSCAAVLCYHT